MSDTRISTSRQDIEEYLIEAAKNYFNTTSIDFYKAGLLGFEIEKMSEMFSDMMVHLSFKEGERFINTAKLWSSASNISREFSYIDKLAVPSVTFAVLSVKIEKQDYVNNEILLNGKDISLSANGVNYCIAGDILIQRQDNMWSAELLTAENFDEQLGSLSSELIVDENNFEYLTMAVKVSQMSINTFTEILPVRNQLVPYSFLINVTTQVVDLKVYRYNSNNEKIYLTKIDSFNSIESDFSKEVYVLEQIDERTYRIFLGDGSRFKFLPSGTELTVDVYETEGSKGQVFQPIFTVTDNGSILTREITAFSTLNSTEGKDALSFDEYKRDILSHVQTPDEKTVITEFDFTNVLSSAFKVKSSDIYPLIRRNDPIQRVNEVFMKLSDPESGELVFTNSIDIKITLPQSTDIDNYNLSPLSIVKMQQGDTFGTILETPPTTEELSNGDKFFITTDYRVLNSSPLRQEVYSLSLFKNKQFASKEEYVADNVFFKIFSKLKKINRVDNDLSTDFFFDVQLSSTDNLKLKEEIEANSIEVYTRFLDRNSGNALCYIKCDRITAVAQGNSDTSFTGKFTALNCFRDGKLEVANVFDSSGNYRNIGNMLLLPEFVDIEIVGFAKDSSTIKNIKLPQNPLNGDIAGAWNLINPNISETEFTLFDYKNIEPFQLFEDFSKILYSEVKKIDDLDYLVERVPMISYADYINGKYKKFLDTLSTKTNLFKETVSEIAEEPSIVCLKYFNTYGFNNNYDGVTESDLKLELEISLNTTNSIGNLLSDIKEKIAVYVNDIGENHSMILSERHIYLSEIINLVTKEFTDVRQCRILNYQDNIYYDRELTYTKLDKNELKTFVPSVLNLRKENIKIQIK